MSASEVGEVGTGVGVPTIAKTRTHCAVFQRLNEFATGNERRAPPHASRSAEGWESGRDEVGADGSPPKIEIREGFGSPPDGQHTKPGTTTSTVTSKQYYQRRRVSRHVCGKHKQLSKPSNTFTCVERDERSDSHPSCQIMPLLCIASLLLGNRQTIRHLKSAKRKQKMLAETTTGAARSCRHCTSRLPAQRSSA